MFVVADSIQSLLDLYDIKPTCFGAVRREADWLFTNVTFGRRLGKDTDE
jgi:hypothetical protein